MPRTDLIAKKLERNVKPAIKALKAKEKVIYVVGMRSAMSYKPALEMNEARQANLEWALNATDLQIEQRIADLSASIPPEALACKYRDVTGLPDAMIAVIAKIEDLEIALGIHPSVTGVWPS